MAIPNKPGVYTLIINVVKPMKIQVGGLGLGEFPAGIYAYTGSALGKGAFSLRGRIGRHLKAEKKKHWHIDFLLISGLVKVVGVVTSEANRRRECLISMFLEKSAGAKVTVKGFGSQDCCAGCKAHLQYFSGRRYSEAVDLILAAHKDAGLKPILVVDLR